MRAYLSSTFRDLERHRRAVYEAVVRAGFECSAMEFYAARDDRPLDQCLKDVRRCDVYIGIFGGRYGFVPPNCDRSITELEYREARRRRLPAVCFLSREADLSPSSGDAGDRADKLQELRAELQQRHTVDFFTTPEDLATRVLAALQHAARDRRRLQDRRKFIGFSLGVAASLLTGASAHRVMTLHHPHSMPLPAAAAGSCGRGRFFESFVSASQWGIVPGDTNQHRLARGLIGQSPYVASAYTQVFRECQRGIGQYNAVGVPVNHREIRAEKNANLLLLGGPVANRLTRFLNEYDERRLDSGKVLPVFKDQGSLRWGFFCGHASYGDWYGKELSATRYEGNQPRRHPLYGLIDRQTGGVQEPHVDADGFVRHDFLLVTRRPHPLFEDKIVISVGGMHGFALAAFAADIAGAVDRIDAETLGWSFYQLLVPARLEHDHGQRHTTANLRWNELTAQKLPVDSSQWRTQTS